MCAYRTHCRVLRILSYRQTDVAELSGDCSIVEEEMASATLEENVVDVLALQRMYKLTTSGMIQLQVSCFVRMNRYL